MARAQRNEITETNGDENATTETAAESAATVDTDRGNIGVVTVGQDTDEWTSSRVRTSNNPVAIAVRDATQGTAYFIVVENDAEKIKRVKRMLRAAAQREDVGMSIHPETPEVAGEPGKVKVRFKTGPRDHRAKPETTGDAPSETLSE